MDDELRGFEERPEADETMEGVDATAAEPSPGTEAVPESDIEQPEESDQGQDASDEAETSE